MRPGITETTPLHETLERCALCRHLRPEVELEPYRYDVRGDQLFYRCVDREKCAERSLSTAPARRKETP